MSGRVFGVRSVVSGRFGHHNSLCVPYDHFLGWGAGGDRVRGCWRLRRAFRGLNHPFSGVLARSAQRRSRTRCPVLPRKIKGRPTRP